MNIQVVKDDNGLPVYAEVVDGSKKLTATVEGSSIKIDGSRRSFTPEMVDYLKLVFPVQQKAILSVPQPLQVTQLQGGKTILFDDMEGLLKWIQTVGTVALDNTVAYNGSQSLKITCGAADASGTADRGIASVDGNFSVECYFAIDDMTKLDHFTVSVIAATGVSVNTASLRYQHAATADRYWQVRDNTGAYVNVERFPSGFAERNVYNTFHSLAFKVHQWVYTDVYFDKVHFQPNVSSVVGALASWQGRVNIQLVHVAGQAVNMWVDDFLLTQL